MLETTEIPPLPSSSSWMPVAGMAIIILVSVAVGLYQRRASRISSYLGSLGFISLLGVLAYFCNIGHCLVSETQLKVTTIVLTLGGCLPYVRDDVHRWYDEIANPAGDEFGYVSRADRNKKRLLGIFSLVRDVVCLLLVSVLTFIAMEIPYNESWQAITFPRTLLALRFIVLMLLAAYFLAQRRRGLALFVIVILVAIGIAEYYVYEFKGAMATPADFLAWRTALSVSGGYEYFLTEKVLISVTLIAVCAAVLMFCEPLRLFDLDTKKRVAINTVVGAVSMMLALWGFLGTDYRNDYGIKPDTWNMRNTYRTVGVINTFGAVIEQTRIPEPSGYSDDAALAIQDALVANYDATYGASDSRVAAVAQFDALQPNIIIVMNESYADLSIFQNLHAGYPGTYTQQNPVDAIARGWGVAATYGGGTAFTEFEFLTSNTRAFSGFVNPYSQLDLSAVNSIVHQFDALGYGTSGMHPNSPDNWDRGDSFDELGFQNTYFIDDFDSDVEYFHGYVSDAATYEMALRIIRSSDEPQLVFDVTMQNHSGYDTGNIPGDWLTDYTPDVGTEDDTAQLNEYLSCINKSDVDLQALVDQLTALDEPTVLVFFGDHQPSLTSLYNEKYFPDESEFVRYQRTGYVPYVVWANYTVAGTDGTAVADTSPNYLSSRILEMIGAPLTDFQKALLMIQQDIPIITDDSFMGSDGNWYQVDVSSPYDERLQELSLLEYYNFASNV